MIVSFLRSSSYGAEKLCPFSYQLQYEFGWRTPSNKAADRGNIVHKALETVARAKLAEQNGLTEFSDPEVNDGRPIGTDVSDDEALEYAWDHYTSKVATHHRWNNSDHSECSRLFKVALTCSSGFFNPRRRTVIEAEKFFEIVIPDDWARYEYRLPDGKVLEGQLTLKGTVDLILEGHRPDILEYVDLKTGQMKDWATGRMKNVDDLYDDFQLRLYHLALSQLYPEYNTILMSIVYVKTGPYSLAFEKDEIPRTYDVIREWFEKMKETEVGARRIGPPCSTFCHFGTTEWRTQKFVPAGTDPHGNHLSICDHVHGEIQQLGVGRVFAKYGHSDRIQNYGSGGGSQNRDAPVVS